MKVIIKFLKIALPILLGVGFVVYAYNKFTASQLEEIKNYFTEANYWVLLLCLSLGFLSCISRAYRWNLALAPLGYKPRFVNNLMSVFITYLVNFVIPRSGEVSRAIAIEKYEKIPFQKAMGTIITERIIDFIILVSFVLFAFVIQFDAIGNFLLDKIPFSSLLIYLFVGVIILGLLYLLFIRKSKNRIVLKLKNFLKGVKEGIISVKDMQQKGWYIFHTLFIWLMYLGMFYVAIFTLEETSNIRFEAVITTFVVGGLAVAFTNGGLGAYPYLVAEILLLYNIPETIGTAFGWIMWTSQFVMFVIFGGLSFILFPIINKNYKPRQYSTTSINTPS